MATLTVPVPHIRALWRPEQFTHCTNGDFETNTSGWVTTAGLNAAGTSITRITTDFHSGTAAASVVTTATDWSGVNFDLGSTPFYQEAAYGTTYAVLVWLKRSSGSRRCRVTFGSLGSPTDKATLLIPDLPDSWTPYRVLWMPTALRTDVELAITNGSAAALTVLVDDVSIYQVDAFSQVENANFFTDTSGWSTGAGINAAGTSIAQALATSFVSGAGSYASVTVAAVDGSGVNYDFGQRKFTSGRTYRARVALKRSAGALSMRIKWGSLGTGADRVSTSCGVTTDWQWFVSDWTPSADRTDVELAITNASAVAYTFQMSAVEVYEAIDELNGTGTGVRADVSHMDWSRGIDGGTGTLNLVVHDPRETRRYTPWNTSGPLYGLLRSSRRVWARAVYADTMIYPVAFGTIRRIIPDAQTGTTQIMCEDPTTDIAAGRTTRPFTYDQSYEQARASLFGPSATEPVAGDSRFLSAGTNTEVGSFFDGAVAEMGTLDYLEQLNEATGTVHYVAPIALSEVMWVYTTIGRSDLTDAASSTETIDDDFHALTGTDLSDETLENIQSADWQAWEQAGGAAVIVLAQAKDPTTHTPDEDDPYLHFTDDRWGTDEGIPEPAYERWWRWTRRTVHRGRKVDGKWTRKGHKKIRVRTFRSRRVYPDAFVPFSMAAGDTKRIVIDWSCAVTNVDVVLTMTVAPAPDETITSTPRQTIIDLTASAACTVDAIEVYGDPYLPLDEQTVESVTYDQVLDKGPRTGPSFSTPYIGSAGQAEGLVDYRNWRYAEARMRPTLTVQHRFPSILLRNPGDHLTVNAALFSFTGKVFVIERMTGSVDMGARLWSMDYQLEELPTSIGTLFTLDTSALGGADLLAY